MPNHDRQIAIDALNITFLHVTITLSFFRFSGSFRNKPQRADATIKAML